MNFYWDLYMFFKMNKFLILFLLIAYSCASQHKVRELQRGAYEAGLNISGSYDTGFEEPVKDTVLLSRQEGDGPIIMDAVRNEDGEMVATDRIQAAVVTARFHNIAERKGKVDLRFEVSIPAGMQDSRWQLRLYPVLTVLGDSSHLAPVIITGKDFRARQLRGYEQYRKFLSTIITDSAEFIRIKTLEIFLRRNIPQLYALKDEQRIVSDEEFSSIFGVSAREAFKHYTQQWKIRRNEARKSRRSKMFGRYVKVPIITEGLRLDTVTTSSNGDFVYEYIQTIKTASGLKKADIALEGEIYEDDRIIYTIPRSQPITFYISSLSSFLDPSEHYMTQIIERRAEANSACWIDFAAGRHDIDSDLSHNAGEIGRIRRHLTSLMENSEYDIDSITVLASCSPEGLLRDNKRLSLRRAEAVSSYFNSYIRHCRDSLRRLGGAQISLDGGFTEAPLDIRFISRGNAENWHMLGKLVNADTLLTAADKEAFFNTASIADPDEREAAISRLTTYRHLREKLYPRLRTVEFSFFLHRKGMTRDTVHTTVLDTAYMAGVQALRDHDFERAIKILRPYADYNTAVACCAMEYNHSAMSILDKLPVSDRTEYLKAILFSRLGDEKSAVQHYLRSVSLNGSYTFRGNLDPEISSLIRKYNLNR